LFRPVFLDQGTGFFVPARRRAARVKLRLAITWLLRSLTSFSMSPAFYSILHVFSLLVLTGFTFYAFAAPAECRKKVMIITGIASLVMFISGFGLITKLQTGFPTWIIVKLVCWLGVSALAGIGFRKRDKAGLFMAIILALIFTAVVTVYRGRFAV
jgi:hypothetical protein